MMLRLTTRPTRLLLGATVATALAVGILAPVKAGATGNPNPGVLPIDSNPFGQSYGEWADDWWNWLAQYPFATNPAMDDTGAYGSQGQSGSVWFLAGTFGGDAVERHLTVPAGKALLVPLVNGAFWAPEDGASEADVRAAVNGFIDTTDTLEATLDGQPLNDLFGYRAQSPSGGFTLGIPASSFLAEVGYAPGDRTPAVSDGYWLMLAPLSVGEHTLHFAATGDYINVDVTYHLTVQPGS